MTSSAEAPARREGLDASGPDGVRFFFVMMLLLINRE
jgi:hypothetical protein